MQPQEFGIHALHFTVKRMPFMELSEDRQTDRKAINSTLQDLFRLGLKDFRPAASSTGAEKRKYRTCYTHRGLINLYFDGYGHNGDCLSVEIKGSAFESTELNWTEEDISRMARFILSRPDTTPNEMHIYVDDKICHLTFDNLLKLTVDHAIRSHARATIHNGANKGDARSIAFGSRPKRLSIYESGRHRYVGDNATVKGKSEEFLDYVRVEAQLSGVHAKAALERFAAGESWASIVLAYASDTVTFLVSGLDSNRARWKTDPAWSKFTEESGNIPMRPKQSAPTPEGKLSYLKRKITEVAISVGDTAMYDFLLGQLQLFQAAAA